MNATIEVIAGTAYLATDCSYCKGAARRFDITSLDNATGTVSSDGMSACPCRTGRTYRLMSSIEAEAHEENARRSRRTESIGEMPDWMF